MADIKTGPSISLTSPLKAPAPGATPPVAAASPTVGTDTLKLGKAAAAPAFEYFGHTPKVTLSMLLKQPIWGDDRTKISSEQWAQMPEAQRASILKLMPTDPARAQFLSYVDPAAAEARKELGALVHKAWDGAMAYSEHQTELHNAEAAKLPDADAQVDGLNKLIEAQDKP